MIEIQNTFNLLSYKIEKKKKNKKQIEGKRRITINQKVKSKTL